jgi:excinuclease ABC subunit A
LNDAIIIRGARTHNLKNISCDIPHGKLTVVSGVSGLGEVVSGLRHHLRRGAAALCRVALVLRAPVPRAHREARRGLIDGLAPAIAIKQKNSTRNPRSTVATATEIYDYLRLFYARCGTVHCIHCDGLVKRDSMDEIAESVLAWARELACRCCFPWPARHRQPTPN